MKEGPEKESLKAEVATLKQRNEQLDRLVAMQKATMHANAKEVEKLQAIISNGEHLYSRVFRGLKSLLTTKARLQRVRERDKKIYFKLILYGLTTTEINRIERDDGYNGLVKKFKELIRSRREELEYSREHRSPEEQAELAKYFKKRYNWARE